MLLRELEHEIKNKRTFLMYHLFLYFSGFDLILKNTANTTFQYLKYTVSALSASMWIYRDQNTTFSIEFHHLETIVSVSIR